MSGVIRRFLKDAAGATAVEYAVLLALILIAAISAVKMFGDGATGLWATNASKLSDFLR